MASHTADKERRSARRVPNHVEVRYGMGGEYILASACDMSPYGIGLLGPKLFPIGSEVDVRFRAPREGTGTLLFLRATVRHAEGSRLGLQFADVPETEREKLREAVLTLHER